MADKEALAYAVELAAPITYEINGETFSSQKLHRVEEKEEARVSALKVSTLTGFVDYLTHNRDGLDFKRTMIQITDTDGVRLVSVPNKDKAREVYVEAKACLPAVDYGRFLNLENFIILLQAAFEQTEDRGILLKYVGNMVVDEAVELTDDGVSQKIVSRKSVADVGKVTLPNPVTLKPYRTFQEVEQTESDFVFRIDKNCNCALFEADGGVWKIKCREKVKEYLRQNLKGAALENITIIG